jgi:hypothetical protein
MKKEYKYMIVARNLKTKLSDNYYHSVQILCKEECDSRFRVVHTMSFNKEDPDALQKAIQHLSQMSKTYY